MIIHNELVQGTEEWLKFRANHYPASEAPVMLGLSPYKTRAQLLHEKFTGITPEIDVYTQRRFDAGHRFEALARPLAEQIVGTNLYPVVASDGKLSASFDGLSEDKKICWEHKTFSAAIPVPLTTDTIPEHYRAQMEQQLMLSGAERCLFHATRWNDFDECLDEAYCWYAGNPVMHERLLQGWRQFDKDLAAYVPPEAIPEIIATPIRDLPAITYKMDGMSLSTNLRSDVKPAILALVEQSRKPLETDQDFADLDALCKKFKQAEEQCALVQSQAVGEIKDVDAFCRDLKELSEIMRQARIAGEKAVASEKDARKLVILTKAKAAYAAYIEALEAETKPILLFKGPSDMPDFAGAMKGLKKLAAMQEAVDNALRVGKMLADAVAKDVRHKLANMTTVKEYAFLFPDLQQFIFKEADDFTLIVTSRITKHEADEAAKIERIRAEEQAKAEAAAKAKIEAEARAKDENESRILREAADSIVADTRARDEASAIEEKRRQAQIAEQSRPFNGAPAKPVRPPDREIIEAICQVFDVSYGTSCDWLLEVAENLKESP